MRCSKVKKHASKFAAWAAQSMSWPEICEVEGCTLDDILGEPPTPKNRFDTAERLHSNQVHIARLRHAFGPLPPALPTLCSHAVHTSQLNRTRLAPLPHRRAAVRHFSAEAAAAAAIRAAAVAEGEVASHPLLGGLQAAASERAEAKARDASARCAQLEAEAKTLKQARHQLSPYSTFLMVTPIPWAFFKRHL